MKQHLHTRVDGVLRVTGQKGCALFGPYIDLPAGHYTVTVILSGKTSGRVRMDISADQGNRVIAARDFNLSTTWKRKLVLCADVAEDISLFEVRLFTDTGARLDIAAIRITITRPPLKMATRFRAMLGKGMTYSGAGITSA
ncbi:glycosyl transferase group 1 [Gluconacetobacter sp. SXCC-1]|nr:glycosyl transferase group 1 [Gluconacetobacter sp. SXCC-1]